MKMANIEALKKIAYDEDNDSAGVGTWDENSVGFAPMAGNEGWVSPQIDANTKANDPNSYVAKLLANSKKGPDGGKLARKALDGVAPRIYQGEESGGSDQIQNPELAQLREQQAARGAALIGGGKQVQEAVKNNLIRAGERNQKAFNQTRTVPYQKLDETSLGGLNLSKEKLELLRSLQNTMVRRGGKAQYAKTAQDASAATPAPAAANPGIWDTVMAKIDEAKKWYDNNQAWRPLIHAGIGAVGLGALNKLTGGKFWRGAMLGGLGGAATGVDWKALADSLGKKKEEPKKEDKVSAQAQQ